MEKWMVILYPMEKNLPEYIQSKTSLLHMFQHPEAITNLFIPQGHGEMAKNTELSLLTKNRQGHY